MAANELFRYPGVADLEASKVSKETTKIITKPQNTEISSYQKTFVRQVKCCISNSVNLMSIGDV